MISTKKLKDGEAVFVDLAGDKSDYIEEKNIPCVFINGVFRNTENNRHNGEIYGSSVVSFRRAASK